VLVDSDGAGQLYPLVVEALETGTPISLFDGSLIQRVAGMVAAAADLQAQAEQHFDTALRQAHELPHLMERAAVRHFYARLLIQREGSGDLERAHVLLEEAIADYGRIGMPRHLEMAEQPLQKGVAVMTTDVTEGIVTIFITDTERSKA
jgi:hypothetical protein